MSISIFMNFAGPEVEAEDDAVEERPNGIAGRDPIGGEPYGGESLVEKRELRIRSAIEFGVVINFLKQACIF